MKNSTKSCVRLNVKTFLLPLILIFIKLSPANAQQGYWSSQNSGTNIKLTSVCFVNDNYGWAVGDSKVILNTTDGGENWMPQQVSVSIQFLHFSSVYFVDESNGWIAGSGYNAGGAADAEGFIFHTTDGGVNWSLQYNEFGLNMREIFFVDEQNGWVVGNTPSYTAPYILHTNDGGISWVEQYIQVATIPPYFDLRSVYFINATRGWAVGLDGIITQTTDGGNNWIAQTIQTTGNIKQVGFFDAENGWALAGNGIHFSTDGGNTWNLSPDNGVGVGLSNAIAFADNNPNFGWGVATFGFGFRTTDGGATWYEVNTSTTKNLNAISFINYKGWAVGNEGTIIHFSGEDESASIENKESKNILLKAFPNPFSNSTTISFELNTNQHVYLRVCDLQGREVIVLTDEQLAPGEHQFVFNGSNLNSGVYVYQLRLNGAIETGKLVLNK